MSSNPFNLPQEYIDFVKSKKSLNVELFDGYLEKEELKCQAIEELQSATFKKWVDQEIEGDDPIVYVPLLTDEEVLVWFPELSCFGQINGEDGEVFAYKNVDWNEIQSKQEVYLMALFDESESEEIDVYDYVIASRNED